MTISFARTKFPSPARHRNMLHYLFLVVIATSWGESTFAQALPAQTLDLSVNPPTCRAGASCPNLSVESLAGAVFRPDFSTWSLIGGGDPVVFNLELQEALPVVLTLNVAAALVKGQPNSPVSILVNDEVLVSQYADTNPHFHPVAWKIPRGLVNAGNNRIAINLTPAATVQYFINAVTVASFGESQRLVSSAGSLYTDLYVQFGLANVTGVVDTNNYPITEVWTRAYALDPPQPDPDNPGLWLPSEDIVPGPTLVFQPDDLLQINFINTLNTSRSQWLTEFQDSIITDNPDDIEEPLGHEINIPHNADNTNLHVHGLHVDPRRDNVTLLIIPEDDSPSNYNEELQTLIPNAAGNYVPGGPAGNGLYWTWLYSYKIPSDHMPGTHWFHAHKHGSTSTQVENGMAGTLIIRPPDESGSFTPGLWHDDAAQSHDRVLVLQEIANYGVQQGAGKSKVTDTVAKTTPDITVNGVHQPVLPLTLGQIERWRIVNAGANHRTSSYFWLGKKTTQTVAQTVNHQTVQLPLYDDAVPAQDGPMTPQMYLVALDGVTLAIPIKISAANPLVLAAGNRADVVVRIPDYGQYALFKNYPAPQPETTSQSVNPGGLTNVKAPSQLTTDPFDLDTNYAGFTWTWPKTVDAQGNLVQTKNGNGQDKPAIAQNQALAPLLGAQAHGNQVSVKIVPEDTSTLSGSGWQPVAAKGGALDMQLLMHVVMVEGNTSNGSNPTDLSTLDLDPFSPTGSGTNLPGGKPPAYAAPITDSNLNIPAQTMVFDRAGIEFNYAHKGQSATFQQFSLNGRQFDLTDFAGNSDAQSLIQTPVPPGLVYPGTSDHDPNSLPLGAYDFSAIGLWTNRIAGLDNHGYWTNPGYYVPVVEKLTTQPWPGTNADGNSVTLPAGTSYYTYDYAGILGPLAPPTVENITGGVPLSQPQAQSAQEWILINNSSIFHPFHIHISPFFVTEIGQLNYNQANGWTTRYLYNDPHGTAPPRQPYECPVKDSAVPYVVGTWWDVMMIPPHGYVKFKTWINVPWQTDDNTSVAENTNNIASWVFHCHILRHEDRGMMMIVKTKPKPEDGN